MTMQRNRGRFLITTKTMREDFEAVQGVFELCVPVRVEHMYDTDTLDVIAVGPMFREAQEGEQTPWYSVQIERDGLTVGVQFTETQKNHAGCAYTNVRSVVENAA